MEAAEALRMLAPALCGPTAAECEVLELPSLPDPRAWSSSRRLREARGRGMVLAGDFLRVPSTGGGFLLADRRSGRDFGSALDLLPLSRPHWRLARRVLRLAARGGGHRFLGLPRLALLVPPDAAPPSLQVAILSGVPGGCQKLVVRERAGDGSPRSFLKAGAAGLPAELVRAEASALRWLAAHPDLADLGPRLLDSREEGPVQWIRVEALSGARPDGALSSSCRSFLAQLGGAASEELPLSESRWCHAIQERMDRLAVEGSPRYSVLRDMWERVLRESGGRALPFAPSHGDFTPWNCLLDGGRLRAFDWEYFQESAPAGSDLFHWIVQSGILMRRREAKAILQGIEAAVAGLPWRRQAPLLLRSYLLDLLSRDENVYLHGRPDFVQTEWLWMTRRELFSLAGVSLESANV